MIYRSLILAVAGGVATFVANPAHAQNFTGPRVEATIGYDAAHTDAAAAALRKVDGVRVGAAVGYDVEVAPRVVIGAEAGIGFDLADKTEATIGGSRYRLDNTRDIDASLRLGYVVGPRTMVYAKAGWANSGARARVTTGTTIVEARGNDDGFRFGGGVEQVLGEHAYVKGEYRYTTYGEGVHRHQALVGFGYRF